MGVACGRGAQRRARRCVHMHVCIKIYLIACQPVLPRLACLNRIKFYLIVYRYRVCVKFNHLIGRCCTEQQARRRRRRRRRRRLHR